jgi:hypothetical protein
MTWAIRAPPLKIFGRLTKFHLRGAVRVRFIHDSGTASDLVRGFFSAPGVNLLTDGLD